MVLWVLQNSLNPNTLLSNTELTTGGLADKSTLMFWATVHEATKSIGVILVQRRCGLTSCFTISIIDVVSRFLQTEAPM